MRRMWKMTGGVVLASVFVATPVLAETLSDALAKAYRNSGLIEQNRAVLRAADEDVATAVSVLRPVLNYTAGVNYSDPALGDNLSASAGLTASMLLYDFGRSQLGVDAAKETVLATRAALVDVENTVLLNAATAYLNVRRSLAFVELRENNVRLLTQQLRATRDRFEVGEVTRTDVSLAEARLAAARSGLAAEQGSLELAREHGSSVEEGVLLDIKVSQNDFARLAMGCLRSFMNTDTEPSFSRSFLSISLSANNSSNLN